MTDEKTSDKQCPPRGQINASLITQWIVSLAVCVVCCAILFVVFAVYLINLQEKITLITLRSDLVQERNAMLQNRLAVLEANNKGHVQLRALIAPPPSAPPSAPQPAAAPLEAPSSASLQDTLPDSMTAPQSLDLPATPPPSDGINLPTDEPEGQ